jgi:hypothetical protein
VLFANDDKVYSSMRVKTQVTGWIGMTYSTR